MTDAGQSAAASDATEQAGNAPQARVAAPAPARARRRGIARMFPDDLLRRSALTLSVLAVLLVVGVLSQALWLPASAAGWYENVAYGLPAFEAGRWWTPLTGTFLAAEPSHYVPITVLILGGLGWAERVLGARRAALIFAGGQLFAIVATALLLLALRPSGWPWAVDLASQLDVGPSGGAFACAAAATAALRAPWRLRARLALASWVGIAALYFGTLPDVEHLFGVAIALVVVPLLPRYRKPLGRPSEREWRLLAFSGLVVIAVVQVIVNLATLNGPLGTSVSSTALWGDVLIDVVIILLIGNGVRRGVRLAWWIAVVLALLNQLQLILIVLVLALGAGTLDGAGFAAASSVLWLAQLAVLLVGRGAFRVPLRRRRRRLGGAVESDAAEARRLLHSVGGGVISWMSTWGGNEYFFSRPAPDAAADAVVAYQRHAGVAIALGDPIATPARLATVVHEFAATAQHSGLTPCAFSVSAAVAHGAPEGWRSLQVAEDTLIDLPAMEMRGKRWQNVRAALNRAEREGISFRLCRLTDEPWAVLAQVRAISEQWVGDKGLPEMKFTLGGVDDALDPEVLVGIAVDADGSIHGVTSWLPVYGPGGTVTGWTLDLMRRRDGGFGPVMEFLIASSALAFKEQGALVASLSGAPLVNSAAGEQGPIERVLDVIATTLEPLYGFHSLHQFKAKFNPRPEPLYLLYRDEADLPRIGIALTKAYLPDASLRDLVRSAV
ncbi:bifunctional lysylphosphatidylglycerol flippase/synthetase MprF [Microterricola gilva]|nr:DUF2156 domain-containing protein [Microterricola gilva]